MADHELKLWSEFFEDIFYRRKTFDVRKNDRNFEVGDHIFFRQWDKDRGEYLGGACARRVTYILPGGQFGIEPGYVVLGIS